MNSSVAIALLVLLILPNALTQTKSLTGATGSGDSNPAATDQKGQDAGPTSAHTEFDPSNSEKKGCTATGPQLVSFRLYETQLYVSAKSDSYRRCLLLQDGSQSPDQVFTASQDTDCIWTFKTFDGLYLINPNPDLNCVGVADSPSLKTGFYLEQGQNWSSVRSASQPEQTWARNPTDYLILISSPERFVMELQPEPKQEN